MKRMFVYILLIFFLDHFFYTLYWSFISSRRLVWALHFFLISKMRFPLIPFLLQRERWISMDPMLAHMKLKFNSLVRSFRLFVYILLNLFFFLDHFFYTLYWSFISSRNLLFTLHFFFILKKRFSLLPHYKKSCLYERHYRYHIVTFSKNAAIGWSITNIYKGL